MSLRRLHPTQPESFAFSQGNLAWAEAQMAKFPEGRQASAVIPLLWRAQEQEGWVTRPAIEAIASMLGLARIRVLEVASFYFMFQLQPVGSVSHVQVCGTTSCMICGAEDLIAVCREKIAASAHELSADGKFSWEEVECLGACSNAPMAQIGKDYYEDLTVESFGNILDAFARGEVPTPGPQNGRFSCEPKGGLTSLKEFVTPAISVNASMALASEQGDTIARITGGAVATPKKSAKPKPKKAAKAKSESPQAATSAEGAQPELLDAPRGGNGDDLKKIKGVGPKLEAELNARGVWHFDQIAAWSAGEVAWADEHLVRFKGRVSRDDWVGQAKKLAADE